VKSLSNVTGTLMVLGAGLVVLFLFFAALGAFSPTETIVVSALAAVFAVAFAIHMYRVHRALEDGGSDVHRALNLQRERRGF
jgi:steroid 5-alpha reductase family enzyme